MIIIILKMSIISDKNATEDIITNRIELCGKDMEMRTLHYIFLHKAHVIIFLRHFSCGLKNKNDYHELSPTTSHFRDSGGGRGVGVKKKNSNI